MEEKENITLLILGPQNRGQIHEPFKNNDNTYKSIWGILVKSRILRIETVNDELSRAATDAGLCTSVARRRLE